MMNRSIKYLSLLLTPFFFAGCVSVGPDYEKPEISTDVSYIDSKVKDSVGEIATKHWWENFNDSTLNEFVEEGLSQSLDIAVALERITAARATLKGKGINSTLSGNLAYSYTYTGSDTTSTTTADSTSLSGALVIDLFGGIRREKEAAVADLYAAIDDSQTARLAYLSELVGAYIDARYYQYALKLTQRSIESREETLEITENQQAAGSGTELDTEQVKALLYSAQAEIPNLKANYLAKIYAMATLLNQSASELIEKMDEGQEETEFLGLNLKTEYETGVPADLLRNRPDVRSAEQDLIAATANIGVATADMLPSITLSGTITGFDGINWNFGPAITLPIFNQGKLKSAKNVAISNAKQAEITWRQTVLDAVEDVQSASSTWLRDREKTTLLKKSMDSYERALDMSKESYEAGATTLLDLLVLERSLATARLSFADALRDMSVNWATLQVSLGAGADAQ